MLIQTALTGLRKTQLAIILNCSRWRSFCSLRLIAVSNNGDPAASSLLGLQVRIPLGAWMFVLCLFYAMYVQASAMGWSLVHGESYIFVSHCVWSHAIISLYTQNGIDRSGFAKNIITQKYRLAFQRFQIRNLPLSLVRSFLVLTSVSSKINQYRKAHKDCSFSDWYTSLYSTLHKAWNCDSVTELSNRKMSPVRWFCPWFGEAQCFKKGDVAQINEPH